VTGATVLRWDFSGASSSDAPKSVSSDAMTRLQILYENVRASLWFVPALLVLGAVALALGLVETEAYVDGERLVEEWPRLFGAGSEGSRGLLSAIAGSMITVAGVSFSITVVALALASTQYTSRVLRSFMRDRANQTVLGVFLGVFAYCLVVLRTIRGADEQSFVPSIAVLAAVLLALVAIGFLIFFIHHVAESIQASYVVEAVAEETLGAVDRLFPADLGEAAEERREGDGLRTASVAVWTSVPSVRTGYIAGIDAARLLAFAAKHNTIVRMERGIGEFVIEACPLASVARSHTDEDMTRELNEAYVIGRNRTIAQDAGYGIRQIVDVALKALSPGINDTTTAVHCVDYLGAILARLAARRIETARRSHEGSLRIIARGPTFDSLVAEAIDEIRQNGAGNVTVLTRLLQVLRTVAERTSAGRRRELERQAREILDTAERTVPSARDRATIAAAAGDVGR
jgi:uncharacterized membrane protein